MRNTSSNQKMSNRTLSQTQPSSQQKTVTLLVFVNFTNDELSYNLFQNGRITSDEEDVDYDYTSKWEYLGKGIWENQVKLTMKNSYVVHDRVQ